MKAKKRKVVEKKSRRKPVVSTQKSMEDRSSIERLPKSPTPIMPPAEEIRLPTAEGNRTPRFERAMAMVRMGFSSARIIEELVKVFACTENAANNDLSDVWKYIHSVHPKNIGTLKTAQLERLANDIGRTRNLLWGADPKTGKPIDYTVSERKRLLSAISTHEMLYARIAGTLAPIVVEGGGDAPMRAGLAVLISEMSPEMMDAMAMRALDRHRTIEAVGVEVKSVEIEALK